jgi:hypothetical protein
MLGNQCKKRFLLLPFNRNSRNSVHLSVPARVNAGMLGVAGNSLVTGSAAGRRVRRGG